MLIKIKNKKDNSVTTGRISIQPIKELITFFNQAITPAYHSC